MQRALRDEVHKEYDEIVMNAAPQLVRMYSCREGESSWLQQWLRNSAMESRGKRGRR